MSAPAPSAPTLDFAELLGPELTSSFTKKGYTTLTPVQRSVLDPELVGEVLAAIRDIVKTLNNLTGGHPLSFRETLRVLIEEGILVRDADDWAADLPRLADGTVPTPAG